MAGTSPNRTLPTLEKARWPVQFYDVEGFRSHWPISSNESVGAVKNAEKVPLGLSKKLLIKPGDPRHDVGKHLIRQCYQCQTQQLTNEKEALALTTKYSISDTF